MAGRCTNRLCAGRRPVAPPAPGRHCGAGALAHRGRRRAAPIATAGRGLGVPVRPRLGVRQRRGTRPRLVAAGRGRSAGRQPAAHRHGHPPHRPGPGRTGRAGKKGLALSIVAPHEVRTLKRIQQVTKAQLTKGRAPSNDELNLYRVKDAISSLNAMNDSDVAFRASKFLDKKMSELKELFNFEFTVEEFLKRYLVTQHPDIFENRDTSMDFVGDGIVPREMQSPGSSFSRDDRDYAGGGRSFGGRSGGGGGRGFSSRGGSRGGGYSDRGSDRGERSFDRAPERSERGSDRSGGYGSAPRSDRGERSFDRGGERGGRYVGAGGFKPRAQDERGSRGSQSEAPAGRTWNADDHEERPTKSKRFSGSRKSDQRT